MIRNLGKHGLAIACDSVPRRCKFILDSLERSYGHKEPAMLDDATIEHVMPQTLTDEWRNMLATDGELERIHDLLVDTIGNLTLTAYNPELSNLDFEEKKKIYASSHYSLNEYFAGCPVWSAEQIENRAGELWEHAKQLWPAPIQSSETVPDTQLITDTLIERADTKLLEAKRELIIEALEWTRGRFSKQS